MLATGLILDAAVAGRAGRRPAAVEEHPPGRRDRRSGWGWSALMSPPARSCAATARELDRFDDDDRALAALGGAPARRRAAAGPVQRRAEAELAIDRRPDGGVHRSGVLIYLSRRPAPRSAGGRARSSSTTCATWVSIPLVARPPLPGARSTGHPPLAAWHDPGHGAPRLGAPPPPEVGGDALRIRVLGSGSGLAHPEAGLRLPAVHVGRPARPAAAAVAAARGPGAGRRRARRLRQLRAAGARARGRCS